MRIRWGARSQEIHQGYDGIIIKKIRNDAEEDVWARNGRRRATEEEDGGCIEKE